MDFEVQTLSWYSLTLRILFSPRAFFSHLSAPLSYRVSLIYLAKTSLLTSSLITLLVTVSFFVVMECFASMLAAFAAIFGVLFSPLISIAANIPLEQVPAAITSFANNGSAQVGLMAIRLGAFLLPACFLAIVMSTFVQAGISHGVARLLGSVASFKATVAAYSFASAAWVLSVVPIVNVIAPLYGAYLNAAGMRSLHGLSTVKAIFAIILAISFSIICTLVIIGGKTSNLPL